MKPGCIRQGYGPCETPSPHPSRPVPSKTTTAVPKPTPSPQLPLTGGNSTAGIWVAVVLIVLGSALIWVSSRRGGRR